MNGYAAYLGIDWAAFNAVLGSTMSEAPLLFNLSKTRCDSAQLPRTNPSTFVDSATFPSDTFSHRNSHARIE